MTNVTNIKPRIRLAQGGSLQNRMAECGVNGQPAPEIGMGATELMYTDTHACTIVEVSASGKRIGVQRDRAVRTDTRGRDECQDYRYEPNTQAGVIHYTLRKTGQWIREGDSMKSGQVLAIGYRREYHDYNF